MAKTISPDEIRSLFSNAMSEMYRKEVPLYDDLLKLVENVNEEVLRSNTTTSILPTTNTTATATKKKTTTTESKMSIDSSIQRLTSERHGAIRLGSSWELQTMKRLFAIMGMYPVSYYDLSVAGIPVHSTAFRPIAASSLVHAPLRIFTSLLRLDSIEDVMLRRCAEALIDSRRIFTDNCLSWIETAEQQHGVLGLEDAHAFVKEAIKTFRWHEDARVDYDTYRAFHDTTHRVVADVVCFHGPHINHLTPRTLDIDAVQQRMLLQMLDNAKDSIEGPPRRQNVPILLRQTSFKALPEVVRFKPSQQEESSSSFSCSNSTTTTSSISSSDQMAITSAAVTTTKTYHHGTHTARFGEIEQRGCALTRKGRKLYDRLLQKVRDNGNSNSYSSRLQQVFEEQFPDDIQSLRQQQLAYFVYRLTTDDKSLLLLQKEEYNEQQQEENYNDKSTILEKFINDGSIICDPLLYEDFLPISAAGIFRSNLADTTTTTTTTVAVDDDDNNNKTTFEIALGCPVYDEFELYEAVQNQSIQDCFHQLFHMSSKNSMDDV